MLCLLVITAIAIARIRDLFAAVMLAGIYGLLSASFFVTLDAVDVAFTEAAVGAGITPLLMLSTLTLVGRYQRQAQGHAFVSLTVVSAVGILLLVSTADMPDFGDSQAPAQTHVAPRYINDSYQEIGIPNVVTSVLASYRGFDTLGEVAVIFTAGLGVISLLISSTMFGKEAGEDPTASMHEHKVLRIIGKIVIPPILIFALYVQFHGEYSPGGGFQAGVIFAAAIILYSMLFGLRVAQQIVKPSVVQMLAAIGLLLYGTTGLLSFLSGNNYLNYSALASDPVVGQHIGIITIELGVGITVASVMILIFYAFSEQVRGKENH